jgi:hypothetical protein
LQPCLNNEPESNTAIVKIKLESSFFNKIEEEEKIVVSRVGESILNAWKVQIQKYEIRGVHIFQYEKQTIEYKIRKSITFKHRLN